MRRHFTLSAAALALFTLPILILPALARQAEAPPPSGLQVTRAVACLEVKEREPASIDTVFSNQSEQIYCWTHIEGAEGEAEIEHVWSREGEEMARVKLPVRSASWRTYSSKKMLPSWTGNWKVEVHDGAGNVLKTVEFRVIEGEAGEGAEKGEAQE